MKKYILEIIIIILVLFFQILLISNININGIKPDLLLILTISFAFSLNIRKSIIIGATIGLIEELFSDTIMGMLLLSYAVVSYLVTLIQESINKQYTLWIIPIVIFFGSIICYEIEFVFSKILNIGGYTQIKILKTSILNFSFSPISYLFLYILKRLENEIL